MQSHRMAQTHPPVSRPRYQQHEVQALDCIALTLQVEAWASSPPYALVQQAGGRPSLEAQSLGIMRSLFKDRGTWREMMLADAVATLAALIPSDHGQARQDELQRLFKKDVPARGDRAVALAAVQHR